MDVDMNTLSLPISRYIFLENARWYLYPTIEDQLLAMYESRKGNNVDLTNVDKTITDVNTLIPEDDNKVYTQTEVDAIKAQLQTESA